MIKRNISELVIHHSAIDQPNLEKALISFNKTHKERFNRKKGYPGTEYIQYHFVIGQDGTVKKTCSINEVLYHASNFKVNQRSIAVCLVGDFDKHPPTAKQYGALIKLIWEFNIKVSFHSDYAFKNCPGILFNKNFVKFMEERPIFIYTEINKRNIKWQKINKWYEYKQTKNDCTRYSVLGGLSDIIGRELSNSEIENFKRWSEMFTDIGSGSNGIIQMDILLKRWNFNHPEKKLACFAASPRYNSKLVAKFLLKGYTAMYARKTSTSFVKDKEDGYIDDNLVEESGRHFTRARLDMKSKMVEEINNYKGSKNNKFKYRDFLEFAKNGNTRNYLLFIYEPKQ